ncbi:MAG: sugar phosphate nucleotidyltransferase [Oscillospiraceae bacterium]|nr:sugar phosphate nucleotidyltransferase [Oscillospiraceae bacterium]
MQAPTLVIMAAGMGSRFGGLKQMTPVDPEGHIIMDFSIFDAVRAGFGRVVCVIKEDMLEDFDRMIGDRVREHVELRYAFQSLSRLPDGVFVPEGRVKPWGTAHAVLCAAEEIDGPFAVINADDFYGRDAFDAIGRFLREPRTPGEQAMVGYTLQNTLTENGSVSRGVCEVSRDGRLTAITERTRIERRPGGAAYTEDGEHFTFLPADTVVSMNLWGFQQPLLEHFRAQFREFLETELPKNPLKAEFYLPRIPASLIEHREGSVQVLRSNARWYGVTYREDLPGVLAAIREMKQQGQYPNNLWEAGT